MNNYDILKEYEAHQTPVPSYEEWNKLKELLKECREILYAEEMIGGNPRYIDEVRALIKRINKVLGEE